MRYDNPVFILGYSRSGTTLLRLILNSHPSIAIPPETELLQRAPAVLGKRVWREHQLGELVSRLLDLKDTLFGFELSRVQLEDLVRAVLPAPPQTIIACLYCFWATHKHNPIPLRWGDKKPQHWPYVRRLTRWYPHSQFVHIKRNPCDAIASMIQHFDHHVKGRWLLSSHVICAWFWRLTNSSIEKEGAVLGPERFMSIRYEDLANNPEETTRRICSFLHVDYYERMLDFYKGGGETPGSDAHPHAETARPVHGGRIGRGRAFLAASQIADVESICRQLMRAWGYPFTEDQPGWARASTLEALVHALNEAWFALRSYRRLRGSL